MAQLGDGGPQQLQVGDLTVKFGEACREQLLDVLAGGGAGVAEVEDVPNLSQRQTGVATAADEVQAGDGVLGVVAVAAAGAFGCGEEPDFFVEAQCLGCGAGGFGELTDAHGGFPVGFAAWSS